MLKTMLNAASVAVGSIPALASAGTPDRERPRYELNHAPMGPRPDQYLFERVYRQDRAEHPRELTGRTNAPARRRLVQR